MPRPIKPNSLYRARFNAGWTQQQLANRVGVSRQMINGYERGTATPSPKTALEIAAVLSRKTGEDFLPTDLFDLRDDAA